MDMGPLLYISGYGLLALLLGLGVGIVVGCAGSLVKGLTSVGE